MFVKRKYLREMSQPFQVVGSERVNFGGCGVVMGSFPRFLISGIFWDAGLRDCKTREESFGDSTGQPQHNPFAVSLPPYWDYIWALWPQAQLLGPL